MRCSAYLDAIMEVTMYISSYRDTRSGIRVKAIIKEYFGRQSVYFVRNNQINKEFMNIFDYNETLNKI